MYNTSPSTLFASRPIQQAFRNPGSPSSRPSAGSSTTPTEDGGRPRRASRNDLFSMDWKWRGDATGTELREELRFKREGDLRLDGSGLGVDVGRDAGEKNGIVKMEMPTFVPPSSAASVSIPTDLDPAKPARITRLDPSPTIFPASSSSISQPPSSQTHITPRPSSSNPSSSALHPDRARAQTSDNIRLKVDLGNRRMKLGSGRYSNVFLGRYSIRLDDQEPDSSPTDTLGDGPELSRTGWNICAVKVFNGDEEGWEMAEKEARILGMVSDATSSASVASSSLSTSCQPSDSGSTGSPSGERGKARVVRKVGLIPEDKAELDDDPESTLGRARLSVSYTHGTGSPRSSTIRASGTKGIEGLGRALPARLGLREEERRSVSDSRLVERAAILGLPGGTVPRPRADSKGRKKSQGEDLARPMLIVEYVPGGTVEAFLKRSPDRVGLELWKKWMKQGLQALDRIQQSGVVHCDLKPANLLLDEDLNLVVADFSSSVIVRTEHGEDTLPTDGIGRGTPPYSSPEMVDPCPTRTFGYASDVFSFGATMYSLITGVEPFRGVRSIELMWNVRKGRFWEWEERARVMRIGQGVPVTPTTPGSTRTTAAAIISPPPRILGGNVINAEGVRRTGSLRESVLSDRKSLARPKLPRMSSSELLLDIPDISSMGVSRSDAVEPRHREDEVANDQFLLPSRAPLESMDKRERAKSLRIDTRLSNSLNKSESAPPASSTSTMHIEPYSDGTPAMVHLNGQDRVEEVVWRVLGRMVNPDPQKRGTARELLKELF